MPVLKKDELVLKLKNIIGDRTDNEALNFIEDTVDTLNSLENNGNFEQERKKLNDDWQKKYDDNDKAWREKYRSRFFNGNDEEKEEEKEEKIDDKKEYNYDNLFKKEG